MYKKISIVIPLFNEEKYIREIIKRVVNVKIPKLTKEIIIIDDHSTDNSLNICKKLVRNYHIKNLLFKIIEQPKNQGKGAALKKGFLASSGDIVIIQDSDLEYDPKDYLRLLEPFLNSYADVVYGSRFISTQPKRVLYFWHYLGNILLTFLSNILTNLNFTDIESGYKVFRGELIRGLAPNLVSKSFGFEPEITAKISKIKDLKIFEVGISYYGRTYSEGKKITWKDGLLAFWEVLKFNL